MSLDKYAHQTDQSFGYEIKETEEYENYFIHKIKNDFANVSFHPRS